MLFKNINSSTNYTQVLNNFVESQKFFVNPLGDLNLLSHEWWGLIKVGGCTFAPITYYIFTQMRFTLSCE
jgi:hypothetical protein